MRKRVPLVIGGGVALLIASQFFNFGLGLRDGGSSVLSDPSASPDSPELLAPPEVAPSPASSPTGSDDAASDSEMSPAITEPAAVTPLVADVVIHEDRYLVVTNAAQPAQREPMSLDELTQWAAQLPGESNGIVVRVARTPDAIAVAEAALLSKLNQAGFAADQVDARRQLVELEN